MAMMMNIKLLDGQCHEIAQKLLSGSFRMDGRGDFGINVEELSEIIKIVFNENNAEAKIEEYYEKIRL